MLGPIAPDGSPMQGMGGPINQIDPLEVQRQMQQAQRFQEMADMLQTPMQGVDSAAEAIAQIARAYMGAKKQKQADETWSQAYEKEMTRKQQEEARKRQEAQAADEKKWLDLERKLKLESQYREQKDGRTSLVKNLEAQGLKPGTPEFQRAVADNMKRGGQTINVNAGGDKYTPMQKKLAEGNAKFYGELRATAADAARAKQELADVRGLLELRDTGKVEEFKARVGQMFGTEAAADMQAFNARANAAVMRAMESLKGNPSDKDLQLVADMAPSFGNDPRANAFILDALNRVADQNIAAFQEADSYFRQNNNLMGFMPSFEVGEQLVAPGQRADKGGERSEADIFSQYGVK